MNVQTMRGRMCLATAVLGSSVCSVGYAQVVVMGHEGSGKYVVVYDRKDPVATAAKLASLKAPGDGWKTLLATDRLGRGSMFCLKLNGSTQFFIAEGMDSGEAAVNASRAKAQSAAAGTGQMPGWCGVWNNTGKFTLETANSGQTLVRDYDGVVVTYTMGRTAAGKKVVHVRGKNTLPGTAATVQFIGVGGTPGKSFTLEPGAGFSMPLGNVDAFDIEIGFQAPNREKRLSPADRALKGVGSKIREHVTIGNEKFHYTAFGVRG